MKKLSDLPRDPLKMPPPYWRGSSAIFQVLEALEDLFIYLNDLLIIHPKIEEDIKKYLIENPYDNEDDEEFGAICDPLWEIEHKIKLKCELIVFMIAIHLEDKLNQVIVFNLNHDLLDTLEKLSPPEKLNSLAVLLKGESIKSNAVFEKIQKITQWRNKYAHGHNTDRKPRSLKANHLISPENYPNVPSEFEFMMIRVNDYLSIIDFLKLISKNTYTKGNSVEDNRICEYVKKLNKYEFIYEGKGDVYSLNKT